MLTLEMQALQFVQYIPRMSDDDLRVLIGTFQKLVPMAERQEDMSLSEPKKVRRIGSLRGQKLISEGYDIDESNDEIARMFGVDHEGFN